MKADATLDCLGLFCPVPIARAANTIKKLAVGQVLEILADDEGIKADAPAWCRATGHQFLGLEEADGYYRVYVRRQV